VDVFFAHPPLTNGNTNRLLREYFPKGTEITDDQASISTWWPFELNNRPRRILGYRTPGRSLHRPPGQRNCYDQLITPVAASGSAPTAFKGPQHAVLEVVVPDLELPRG
jgi:hypothetical protein